MFTHPQIHSSSHTKHHSEAAPAQWLLCGNYKQQSCRLFSSISIEDQISSTFNGVLCPVLKWGQFARMGEEKVGKLQQAPFPRNTRHPVNICNHSYHFPCIIILHTFQPNIAFKLTGGLNQSDVVLSLPPAYTDVIWSNANYFQLNVALTATLHHHF